MSINELIITVLSNVLFISLFIGFFFFTYVAHVENLTVKNQMKFLANDISGYINFTGPHISSKIKNIINNISIIDFKEVDLKVEKLNKKTSNNAILANVIFAVIIIGIIIALNFNKPVDIKNILIKNFIILIFIALTEFSFIHFFVSEYISLNTNVFYYQVIKNLKKLYNSN